MPLHREVSARRLASRVSRTLILVAAGLAIASCSQDSTPPELPALQADIAQTSVSGVSSGAYMAGQFQMAHASSVVGAAIIAGGPYGCAESVFAGVVFEPAATMLNASKAISGCMSNAMAMWGVPDPERLADKAAERANAGAIDPLADVKTDKIYLFSGTADRTVVPAIVSRARDYYLRLGVPESNIRFVSNVAAGHAFVTEASGGACGRSAEPFVVDCDYDQAKDLLNFIYGPLASPSAGDGGQYVAFDQRPFLQGLSQPGLADQGTVYIPEACRGGGCRIHIAFHGCKQSEEEVGDAFVKGSGFARWADTNRFVVLFPQIESSGSNPQGCWDWWGYTGNEFLTRAAPQIVAVDRMRQRLASR